MDKSELSKTFITKQENQNVLSSNKGLPWGGIMAKLPVPPRLESLHYFESMVLAPDMPM